MSKSGTDTRPHLNRRRWPQLWNRVSLMLPELLHMVVKFLLERCFQIPPWHLVCGNSLQAKKSVNLKKKLFFFPEFFTTPHYPGSIYHCSFFLSCLLIFLKFIYAKEKYRLICSIILIIGFWKRFRDHRNVTCCNKQRSVACAF